MRRFKHLITMIPLVHSFVGFPAGREETQSLLERLAFQVSRDSPTGTGKHRWSDFCVKYPAQSATLQPQRENDIIN